MAWYREGLRFSCVPDCGNCCTGSGIVEVGPAEVERLAAGLGMTVQAFGGRYLRRIGETLCLTDKGPHGDCVFYGPDRRCEVYDHRPNQCRSWPFWPSNLTSRRAWDESARRCPGMGQGTFHPASSIALMLTRQAEGTPEPDGWGLPERGPGGEANRNEDGRTDDAEGNGPREGGRA
jgi:Fe-S-cluster containining protein